MMPISNTRDSRILSHTGLPRMLAARVARCAPASVDLDDLIAAGTEGLIQAAERFDEAAGVPFASFAQPRVRGAILRAAHRALLLFFRRRGCGPCSLALSR
jgi:RNA polymerase sigma factor for flagellar operon FliA